MHCNASPSPLCTPSDTHARKHTRHNKGIHIAPYYCVWAHVCTNTAFRTARMSVEYMTLVLENIAVVSQGYFYSAAPSCHSFPPAPILATFSIHCIMSVKPRYLRMQQSPTQREKSEDHAALRQIPGINKAIWRS